MSGRTGTLALLRWLSVISSLVIFTTSAGIAQNIEGQIIASQYGTWQVPGYAPDTFNFAPTSCRVNGGASFFAAFAVGTPVKIVDGNPRLTEIVTPTSVTIDNTACSISIAPADHHNLPFFLTSATGGLQEAINANYTNPASNTIVLDNRFYQSVGPANVAAVISAAAGYNNLGLVDITTTPYTWYAWSGSAYAKIAVGGGSPGGTAGALQSNGNGNFAGTVISGLVKGNGAAAPSAAIPGTDYQTPITNACTGGVSCPLTGGTYNFSYSGSAGSGVVGTGSQYQDATYPNAGSTTAVGAATNKYTLPTGLTTAQLDTWFAGRSTGTATIQNGDNATPFANPNFVGVHDFRESYPVSDWNVKESGAQCDLQGGFASLTAGSRTLTITAGYSLSTADIGKYVEMVGFDASTNLPSRFDPTIVAVANSTTATLSTPSPFTVSGFSMDIGHRDDAAIASAFDHFSYQRPISFPNGICWSDTIAVWGQSFHGISSTESQVAGLAGDDVFATLDPTNSNYHGQVAGMQIHDMTWDFDPRINAAKPWEDVNASGAVTAHAAVYRPVGLWTVWANYPLGPGWMQGSGANDTGATNGVAATAQNSAVICIPTSETQPPVGQEIIFPYFPATFTSTVSSLAGSGCAPGSNPLTMAAALPDTSGYTTAQSEWVAGVSVQTITQSNASGSYANGIPATGRTYPFILRLANNINPPATPNVAGTGSNVAPYGLVQIDGEQCTYFGGSSYPASTSSTYWIQVTACAQNGTTAAAHNTGATIIPLNPFQPTWPWPVTPSLNAGVMPANASYFPAWNIGNAAWAQPVYDGVDWAASAALSFSDMHDIQIQIGTFYAGSGSGTESPNGFQEQNATAGMYIVPLPYNATFKNIHIIDPQFGIFEGTPSINTYGMFGSQYPTADGSTWQNITIQSAGFDTLFVGGQSDTKRDFLTFCQNGGETGNSWPGLTPAYLGCGAAWIDGGTYDDQSGGGGSDNTHRTEENWYVELESGAEEDQQPYFEFNCGECTYRINPQGGGVTFIDGNKENFTGMQFDGGQSALPIINYGYGTTMSNVSGVGLGATNNTYGLGVFLNYGANASISGQTDGTLGPFGSLSAGNSIAQIDGQTGDAFETGNDAAAYVSASAAIIYPDQFNANLGLESDPMSVGWTFDDTAPVSHSYTACNTTDSGGCNTHAFNGVGIPIGPGQKIVPGKYIAHFALRTVHGSNTLNLQFATTNIGAGCGSAATVYNQDIATSSTWTQYTTPPIDFTGTSPGCGLNVWLNGTTVTDQVRMAYLVLTPVWTTVTLPVDTPADNAACSPGAFLGSDATYLYICTASGVVKRAALSAY